MTSILAPLGKIGRHIRTTFSAGLLVMIPIGVTALIIKIIVSWFDPLLKPAFESFLGEGDYREGMGIGALIVLIYLAGLLTTHVIGRRIIGIGHRLVNGVPVIRAIYSTLLMATEVFSNNGTENQKYSGVVLVDFPKEGSKAVGLITARVQDEDGETNLAVYIPTTPVPTSGFLIIVKEADAVLIDVTVDEAMKLIVSGGILTPEHILRRRYQPSETTVSNH